METRDDDLPEMGWGRVVVGGELFAARENWSRGQACAFAAELSAACAEQLKQIPQDRLSPGGLAALTLAQECFAPGQRLGEACGLFWGRVLRGLGLVLVDASLPELAHASAWAAQEILEKLEEAWGCLEDRARELVGQGLPLPLRLRQDLLPFFRLVQGRRQRLAAKGASRLLSELDRHPERLAPNVWLRPLLQDAALGTTTAILGSSELAYHWQAQDLWELAGVPRPRWQLRPHITVVGPAERRWAEKLGVVPEELLSPHLPRRLLRVSGLVKDWERFSQKWLTDFQRFAEKARAEQPSLTGDLEATQKKLMGSFSWLAHRLENRAEEKLQVERQRFFRLRQSLQPLGGPQERVLSAVSPLLALGLSLPLKLSSALQELPWEGMHLLYWGEGGLW
ncbi:MAG: bacillithiol biosynthesis BshC [Thermoanaerobaculum sp.]